MNLYKVLGVKKTATDEQIKCAYRELAKKHHPDVGGDQEQFKNINAAYTILSDPEQRKAYDELGTIPGTPEFDTYKILVEAFRNKVQEASRNGRGLSIFQLRGENSNAIKTIKKQISDLKGFLKVVEANSQRIVHIKSKKSKFNAYQKACDLLIEELEGSILTSKKALERALLVEEELLNYDDADKTVLIERTGLHYETSTRRP